ncbi:MAG: pirin family protein [Candidatus Cloacimonadaceae bacterium]|nr:pirin family protein [Candidatus Cloacimonadaceae bacterium]MDP3113282.1 pirin family protein [Candidatus Cloacimonadaceae bacterium]
MRKIKLVKAGLPTLEGAGVRLHRAFGYYDTQNFDPFLMLDDFRNDDPDDYLAGFPWHPHRGIETITYMLDGSAEHGDSIGNKGTIRKGEVQWMTAGSGIIHQEMPKPDKQGRMYGFQLWANLPASHKMIKPRYQNIKASQIPAVHTDNGITIKLICGCFMGVSGPVKDIIIDPQFWDISFPPQTQITLPAPSGYTCVIYCYDGDSVIDAQRISNRQVVLFEDGKNISIQAGTGGVRILFLCGKPLGEPISWRGPIVMNTKEEIQKAFQELDEGSFIRK